MKKILIPMLSLLLLFSVGITVSAATYTDPDTNVKFTVPASWTEKALSKDREYIDVKFVSNEAEGMSILYGSTDFWAKLSASERAGYSRSDINMSAFTHADIAELADASIHNVKKVTYNGVQCFQTEVVTPLEFEGYELTITMTHVIYIDNGWFYWFQFSGSSSSEYFSAFKSLLNTVTFPQTPFANNDESLIPIVIFGVILVVGAIIVLTKQPRRHRKENTMMNKQLGTKWFIFYTKIRPWLVFFGSLKIVVDFCQYTDVYLSTWWTLLYFVINMATTVVAILVLAKSKGDYGNFVQFVKGALLFEVIALAYTGGAEEYLEEFEIGSALAVSIVILVLGYFLWYRLNMKYFEKRILETVPNTDYTYSYSTPSPTPPPVFVPTKASENNNINTATGSTPPEVQFCRKCGTKLPEDAVFCCKCGTKTIILANQKATERQEGNKGLFSQKKKITVDEMSMQMMLAAHTVVGKLRGFNDLDDSHSMAVSMGYFYGFLKLHLNSITDLDTANTIVQKSISNLENATKGNPSFENFGYKVRTMANNSSANMQYAMKDLKDNPFMGMAIFYLNDLYNSTSVDFSKVDVAESNMRMLYGMVSDLTKDTKIVK